MTICKRDKFRIILVKQNVTPKNSHKIKSPIFAF